MTFTSDPTVQRLGWVLVHSLWQGVVLAAVLAAALRATRRRSADTRYALSCAVLALLAALPALNFLVVPQFHRTTLVSKAAPTASMASEAIGATTPPSAEGNLAFAAETPSAAADAPAAESSSPGAWWNSLTHRLELLFPWLVGAWAVGVVALSAWHVGGWVQVQRIRRSHTRPLGGRWDETLNKLASRLRVTRPVRLLESALVQVPAVVGWLRPVILVPASAVAGLSPQDLEAILAHELAHVRRHDYFVNVLQAVVETLLFYNPAVWWVSHQVRLERENCCDDIASGAAGGPLRYARALAAMEELRASSRPLPRPALAAVGRGGPLLRRVRRLVSRPDPTAAPRPRAWPLTAAAVALACPLVPLLAAAVASKPAATKTADTPSSVEAAGPSEATTSDPAPTQDPLAELTSLYDERIRTSRELAEVKTGLERLANEGTDGTEPADRGVVAEQAAEAQRLEERLAEVKQQIERVSHRVASENADRRARDTAAAKMSVADIARVDAVMQGKVQARDRITADLAQARLKFLPNHPTVLRLAASHRAAEEDVEQYAAEFRGKWVRAHLTGSMPEQSLVELARREPRIARLLQSRDAAEMELSAARRQLGEEHATVVALRHEVAAVNAQVQKVGGELLAAPAPAAPAAPAADRPAGADPNPGAVGGGNYFISGVPRAGAYAIGPRPLNLLQALIAGGLDVDQGRAREVVLFRRAPGADRETVTTVTVGDLIEDRGKDVALQPDDMIMVKAAPAARPAPPAGAMAEAPEGLWGVLNEAFRRFGLLGDGRRPTIISAYVSADGKAAYVAVTDPRAERGSDREAVLFNLSNVGDAWKVDNIDASVLGGAGVMLEQFQKKQPGARRFAKPFSVAPAQAAPGGAAPAQPAPAQPAAAQPGGASAEEKGRAAQAALQESLRKLIEAMKESNAKASLDLATSLQAQVREHAAQADGDSKQRLAFLADHLDRIRRSLEKNDLDSAAAVLDRNFGSQIRPRRQPAGAGASGTWAETVWNRIGQRKDPDERTRALEELLVKVTGNHGPDKAAALRVLARAGDVAFDRAPFTEPVRRALSDGDHMIRAAALPALKSAGGSAADVPAVARLADDPAAAVRANVVQTLYAVAGRKVVEDAAVRDQVFAVVDRLLDDHAQEVQVGTIRALWGNPVGPAAEKKLVELSRSRDRELAHDAVYYGLIRRPTNSKVVADRLIEMLVNQEHVTDTWCPSWGLSVHPVVPESRDAVVEALVRELDNNLDRNVRTNCVQGLALHGGAKAKAKLKELAETEESEQVRKAAQEGLKRLEQTNASGTR